MSLGTITGRVTHVVYQDPNTGFAVFDLETSRGDKVRVAGELHVELAEGLEIRATGEFRDHPRFGRQFRGRALMVLPPSGPEGIRAYLASGRVKGVGKTLAGRLADHFGDDLERALDEGPSRLEECPGIGGARAQAIHRAWTGQARERENFVLLASMGLTQGQAAKVIKVYGDEGPARVQRNPYDLVRRVSGIGFKTADSIAARAGLEPGSPARLQAAVEYVLDQAAEQGHVYLPMEELVGAAAEVTSQPGDACRKAVEALAASGAIVRETRDGVPLLFKSELHAAEVGVAAGLKLLAGARPAKDVVPDPKGSRGLVRSQVDALSRVLRSTVAVLTGGPGTGKTTLVSALLGAAFASGLKAMLAAPTGRAAMRLKETTGREARTIHRLLEFNPRTGEFNRNEKSPLDADWVVVDEASMMDVVLMDRLLRALPPGTRLTLVGDADQLPPVGPGDPFRDVIASGFVPVATLSRVFRQGAGSGIVEAAHEVLLGRVPEMGASDRSDPPGDFHLLYREDPADLASVVERLVVERIPARFGLDPLRDVQVLSPMRKGDCGTDALNRAVRARLNPEASHAPAPGDRVIQTRNNYDKEIFNGDIGIVVRTGPDGAVVVRFEDREVLVERHEQDDLALAHAVTVHKSQGSEFPAVVMVLHTQHFVMLRRNLLYTGLTRGRRLVVLCASKRALKLAVDNARVEPRYTTLAHRLRAD